LVVFLFYGGGKIMKLKIKKKYFDEILSKEKSVEYREAHITFVCEETGRKLRAEVIDAHLEEDSCLSEVYPDCKWEDGYVVVFTLGGRRLV
jgi:hypothetical protein